MTDPWTADTNANYAVADAMRAVDERIAGLDPANAIYIFSVQDHAATNYVRNPDCWAAGIDLTCCSPWNSFRSNLMAGTLISPRHVLFAAHFDWLPTSSVLRFVDRENNVVERVLQAKVRHPDYDSDKYPDLTVGLLNADVPTNQISFAKVLPDDYRDYIADGRLLPAVRLDQEEKALVGDLISVAVKDNQSDGIIARCEVPVDPVRLAFYEDIKNNDSGNPCFLVLDGHPVLLTVWHYGFGGSGASVVTYKRDIDMLMTNLLPVAEGGYTLTELDLSTYGKLDE